MALTKVKGTNFIDGTITDSKFTNTTITSADMALDPRNASNISSGSVPLAQLGNIPAIDLTGLDNDIALLGFKTAANGSLAKYNLVDQTVDAFEDASGVDAGSSTGETRNSTGKYYSGAVEATATGGTITTDGDYTVHKFTANGTFTTDTAQDVEYLVVGGGGAGGGTGGPSNAAGGGGGAGGYRTATGFSVTATSYSIIVGTGGVGANSTGPSGGVSTFSTITSAGGGGGGAGDLATNGVAGGAGGGASRDASGGAGNTPSTSPAQGFAGGTSGAGGATGGGGGASEVGGAATVTGNPSGAGGDGIANDIIIDGTPVTYAGGGGGGKSGSYGGTGGAGGAGGGGAGGTAGVGSDATGTGSGGGGGGGPGVVAGDGSDGIVVIRRPTVVSVSNMTLVSTATTAQAVPTKGDMVMTYTNGAGTAVINTNIKGYVSRDGGTTYTQGTLVSQGTTGGHTIASFHDLDISGQPSGQSMRYKIDTLVQSAAMQTRIQAVSLGWS